jgi:hypothetical protein
MWNARLFFSKYNTASYTGKYRELAFKVAFRSGCSMHYRYGIQILFILVIVIFVVVVAIIIIEEAMKDDGRKVMAQQGERWLLRLEPVARESRFRTSLLLAACALKS